MESASGGAVIATSGRKCGNCALCCKLPRIEALKKPVGKWCSHVKPDKAGCSIYESRPEACRHFHCTWLASTELDDPWYPLNAKIVVDIKGLWITAQVDPSYPNRWREEPYYSRFKTWSRHGIDQGIRVL